MQKSTYAVAGVQMQPGMRMNVRSHVYMPDAEAGREDERQQYFAGSTTERISRQPVTIRKGTINAAASVNLSTSFMLPNYYRLTPEEQ